jgi:putative outer membrane protein
MKKVIGIVLASAVSMAAFAQSGTNSPYSQFGLGGLSEQSSGFNRGMNGLGLGFHEGNQVNYLNPASYARLDTLTFLFDAGISLHLTNFSEKGVRRNAKNANIEYVVAGFKAARRLGLSFGLIPFSNVGYQYSASQALTAQPGSTILTNTYTGTGGVRQAYLGIGWEPIKGLALGANMSYMWGDYNRRLINSYSDGSVNNLVHQYTIDIRSYKVDFGAQYTAKVSSKDYITLGLTFSPTHKIGGKPQLQEILTNSQTNVSDTTSYGGDFDLNLPNFFGVGMMWNHNDKWKVGADYTLQQWSSVKFPSYEIVGGFSSFALRDNVLTDRHKLTLGGDFCPAPFSRNFFNRIHYRAGVSYATPYIKVYGNDGPTEMSASIGFGIPIINPYNNRSFLNVSAQWVHSTAKNYITENVFRINVGLTFNELWFKKWKLE